MSMGSREDGKQDALWVATSELARGEGHVFYRKLNEVLARHGFDAFVEARVKELEVFSETMGRPSIPPGVYCRMMFVGFFEGLSSERGIAWRCGDSHSLREFLGYGLTEATPDHSTLSVMRHRLPEGFHREVFDWVLKVAAEEKVLKGRKLAIDATTLEANAAMRTIVRRADGASYQKYLKKLAKAEGIENPTPQDLGRMDRKRKGKKVSNKEWKSPSDPDARIARMKDGTTHLAYKAEHAVDLESGVVIAAEIHAADQGDTRTLPDTLERAEASAQKANPGVMIRDIVTDCGYHDTQTLEGSTSWGTGPASLNGRSERVAADGVSVLVGWVASGRGGNRGPSIGTAGESAVKRANACFASAGKPSREASLTPWRPAGCAAPTCGADPMSESATTSMSPGSTSASFCVPSSVWARPGASRTI